MIRIPRIRIRHTVQDFGRKLMYVLGYKKFLVNYTQKFPVKQKLILKNSTLTANMGLEISFVICTVFTEQFAAPQIALWTGRAGLVAGTLPVTTRPPYLPNLIV